MPVPYWADLAPAPRENASPTWPLPLRVSRHRDPSRLVASLDELARAIRDVPAEWLEVAVQSGEAETWALEALGDRRLARALTGARASRAAGERLRAVLHLTLAEHRLGWGRSL